MIICYNVPEIRSMTDAIAIFHFGLFFALFTPPNSPKKENLKKKEKKKNLEILSIYTSVPKTMIMCPVTAQKIKISKKKIKPGDIIIFYNCTKNYDYKLHCS